MGGSSLGSLGGSDGFGLANLFLTLQVKDSPEGEMRKASSLVAVVSAPREAKFNRARFYL